MPRYEYKVVPAPKKPNKIKGLKGTEARFAGSIAALMNEYGAEGWEYQRSDTLPCEERHGLTGRTTVFQNMLIFRREINALSDANQPATTPEATGEPAEPMAEPTVDAAVTVPSFRSASAAASTPSLGAAAPRPEGQPPTLGGARPSRSDDIAAQ